jgi:S-adenosylmethionine:tRNA ribosyltransferase-isomerase
MNDTRVLPARFMLKKATGGLVDGLFLRQTSPGRWRVMLKNVGNSTASLEFANDPGLAARVVLKEQDEYEIEVASDEPTSEILARLGRMPLPPYIRRDKGQDARDDDDRQRYQTVYARESGAVAAPTAGLHFTPEIFKQLAAAGVERTFVTLHVGLGTFKPVTADTLEGHQMHAESYSITADAAGPLNRAKGEGRRIIAVGTTSARVLESQAANEPFVAKSDHTSIFIYAPYQWKHVSAMITNFHLPRSTLIAMIAALVGLDEQRRIYDIAIRERYRFFSYGDVMFVE